MSDIYNKARKEYLKLREQYLNNELHPNHLEGLRARKKYFKDNSYELLMPKQSKNL